MARVVDSSTATRSQLVLSFGILVIKRLSVSFMSAVFSVRKSGNEVEKLVMHIHTLVMSNKRRYKLTLMYG